MISTWSPLAAAFVHTQLPCLHGRAVIAIRSLQSIFPLSAISFPNLSSMPFLSRGTDSPIDTCLLCPVSLFFVPPSLDRRGTSHFPSSFFASSYFWLGRFHLVSPYLRNLPTFRYFPRFLWSQRVKDRSAFLPVSFLMFFLEIPRNLRRSGQVLCAVSSSR